MVRVRILVLALLVGAVVYVYTTLALERAVLTVAFLDIGQGDAIYIRAPSGEDALVDAGPDRSVIRALGTVMSPLDHAIDVIVATHPDKDHIGGFAEVLRRYDVAYIVESGNESDTNAFAGFRTAVEGEGATRLRARRGMRIWLDDTTHLDVLYPDKDVSTVESNEASIVTRLVYGKTAVVLTGDAPRDVERHLVALDGTRLRSNILKLGHHGSRTSSDPSFVRAVGPEVAVVSAGKGNRYGHPHKETLDTLAALAVPVVSTIERGTIVFTSDGEHIGERR